MGNSDSKKKVVKGSILIILDCNHLMTGSTLKGIVSLQLEEDYPS